jgi:hypothetical protein
MTRSRLAAVAALAIAALLVTATGGEAAKQRDKLRTFCGTKHGMTRDWVMGKAVYEREQDAERRASASRFVPVENAKVITKLKDLTASNGDNVVDGKDVDRTNDDGVAKTKLEFDNFGNYRLKFTVKIDGDVVATDAIDFGVSDRVNGACDPPLAGAG